MPWHLLFLLGFLRRGRRNFSFLLLFIFFIFFRQLSFPFLSWGLASDGRGEVGDVLPFPFFGIRSSGREGATLFSPFVSFFGVSPRDAERGLRKIPSFSRRGGISAFSEFPPRFLVGTCGC